MARINKTSRLGKTSATSGYRGENGYSYRTLAAQFIGDHMRGKLHGMAQGTRAKLESHAKLFWGYMHATEGLNSYHDIKKPHVDRFIEHLKRTPSQKASLVTERVAERMAERGILVNVGDMVRLPYNDKTIADIMSSARKIVQMVGKPWLIKETNDVYGVSRNRRRDEEKPINFTPDWVERREAHQQKLEDYDKKKGAEFHGPAAEMRYAFGLREKESIQSASELYREAGQYWLKEKGTKEFRPVTEMALATMYKASFSERLAKIKDGVRYLVVEGAKGGRRRIQAVYSDLRRAALDRVQEICVRLGQASIIPHNLSLKQGLKQVANVNERLGGTGVAQLNANADRHWDTRRLKIDGFSKEEATEERGHSDQRKLAYYTDDAKNW